MKPISNTRVAPVIVTKIAADGTAQPTIVMPLWLPYRPKYRGHQRPPEIQPDPPRKSAPALKEDAA